VDESNRLVAVLYADLFSRPGKSPNPAHFTLRCSRQISDEEIQEAAGEGIAPFDNAVDKATDGMAANMDPATGKMYTLPTIALICDFTDPRYSSSLSNFSSRNIQKPTLLTFNELRTLFHEMGHAVHSILGRTQLQNVSGTRCATDFAELPSVLMEHFATAPEVLGLWARHYETDKPLPYGMVAERLEIEKRCQGAEIESQVLLAMLDQRYHGITAAQMSNSMSDPSLASSSNLSGPGVGMGLAKAFGMGRGASVSGGFDSTRVYREVYDQHCSIPEPAGTAWQGFFGHLFGYGATYYSYLFDRAIASKMWNDVFQATDEGALDRRQGEKFRTEVLRWGGGRGPWKCIAGALGKEEWAEGGERGMKEVGRWGVNS